jgi:hypothetical protein
MDLFFFPLAGAALLAFVGALAGSAGAESRPDFEEPEPAAAAPEISHVA